jgi:hypothetical protein
VTGIIAVRRAVPVVIGAVVLVLLFTLPHPGDAGGGLGLPPSGFTGSAAASVDPAASGAVIPPAPVDITGPSLLPSFEPPAALPDGSDLTSVFGTVVPGPTGPCAVPNNQLLDGYDNPFIGHTGSSNGTGGSAEAADRKGDMDAEAAMGLRWTWIPAHWSSFEKDGPTSPDNDPAGAWKAMDNTMADARARKLNVFFQAPVVGGNAGGPPAWAGRRTEGSAAPKDMDALIAFTAKLAERYKPCGTLAAEKGWTDGWGVRLWELDNEPDTYETHWDGQADDYAEFVTKAERRIHAIDPFALTVGASTATGSECPGDFVDQILDKGVQSASADYVANGVEYAAGPSLDIVSFHTYEFLDEHGSAVFGCDSRTTDNIYRILKATFDKYANQAGFKYAPKTEFWHTEGGYDFGTFDAAGTGYKANWTVQWMARCFAAGMTRLSIMDAHNDPLQQQAVKTWLSLFPKAKPDIQNMTAALGIDPAVATVYRVRRAADGGWTYVAHAANNSTAGATVQLPVRGGAAILTTRTGAETNLLAHDGKVTVTLAGGAPFSEPVFVVDIGS